MAKTRSKRPYVVPRAAQWLAAPRRIALSFAVRGTVAMMVPFAVLLELGYPAGGVFAAIGGLYAMLAGAGGAYQQRLGAMALALSVGAVSVFVGAVLPPSEWLSPVVLAAVALLAGMARVFGRSGISLGLSASIMFLVGTFASAPAGQAGVAAGFYALGCLWVMVFQLLLWWTRPYRILLHQVAASFEACAALVATLALAGAGGRPAIVRRRMRVQHQRAREAIRAAEATYEAVRLGAGHGSVFFDRVALLLAAASREAVAATSLRGVTWPPPNSDEAGAWQAFLAQWQTALLATSRLLLNRGGVVPVASLHASFDALTTQQPLTGSARASLRLALLHLDTIADIGTGLSGLRFSWRESVPRLGRGGLRGAARTLVAQLTFRSIIFRHALRVAVASGFGLWFAGAVGVTHPLWLPMTVIIVLQPEFGATWRRMGQRIGGTLIGVLIAGAIHVLVHGNGAELPIIAVFAAGTFYFIRSHYGVGVVMLTPMILLLLGVLVPGESGSLIMARGVDTLLGGALALIAAYCLWPLWQRTAYLPACAKALRAVRAYLAIAFALPGDGVLSHSELMQTRHEAERANDNANATLRRMLSERRDNPAGVRAALSLMAYLHRLADNAARFAVELGGDALTPLGRARGAQVLQRLDNVIRVLEGTAAPDSLNSLRKPLSTADEGDPLGHWFERFAADTSTIEIASRRLARRRRTTPRTS